MERWTERRYRAALAWLHMQQNDPSRTDHYIMQLTGIVRGKKDWTLDELKIKFSEQGRRAGKPQSDEERTAYLLASMGHTRKEIEE